jgi:hypothetical protein
MADLRLRTGLPISRLLIFRTAANDTAAHNDRQAVLSSYRLCSTEPLIWRPNLLGKTATKPSLMANTGAICAHRDSEASSLRNIGCNDVTLTLKSERFICLLQD